MERYHKAMLELSRAALVAEKGLDLIHWNLVMLGVHFRKMPLTVLMAHLQRSVMLLQQLLEI